MVSAAPPAAGSTVTRSAPLPVLSTFVTFDDSRNVQALLLPGCAGTARRPRRPCRAGCGRGTRPPVTSEPSRRQTEPSSSPITPAPTTTSRFGTLVELERAGRGDDRFSSIATPGSGATSEPVAMTMFFVSSVCFVPSCAVDLDLARRGDAAGAEEGVDLVLLEQELDALDVAVDALVLERHHRRQIELRRRRPRCPSRRSGAPASSNSSRGVQQRLRGDAADVEAGAADASCASRPRRSSGRAAPRGWRRRSRRGRCR